MNHIDPEIEQARELKTLADRVMTDWLSSEDKHLPRAPGLFITDPGAPLPELRPIEDHLSDFMLTLDSDDDSACLRWRQLPASFTDSRALPIQSASLGLVILNHMVSKGDEVLLDEVNRVLKPGGVVLILGMNRNGLRYLAERSKTGLPGLRPLNVREHLEELGMRVRCMIAAGFLKRLRPEQLNVGMARILIPCADLLMIVARKEELKLITPLEKSRLRAAGVPSAMAGP